MKFEIILISLIICKASCIQLEKLLKRNKRWNNGDMNNNGDMSNMFRGVAGVDYPDLKTIPLTNFRCDDQIYEGGLYADVETGCQVYHVCHEGRKDSFLCGKGTIFNQEILACDYWYSADCEKAPSFYYVNSQIGSSGGQPQQNNYQQNPANNYQDGRYRSNEPVHTSYQGDNANIAQPQDGTNSNQPSADKDCCCQKYSYKTPWAFPSS